jgi:hypothetical protein
VCHKPAYRNPAGVRRIVRGKAAIETSVEADYPKLDALYKEIHAHPEIAFSASENRKQAHH